jgi:formylglycine-generating enzyme required for sulfatase activity
MDAARARRGPIALGCGSVSCTTVEVGSLAGCQSSVGGFAGVYDLSGNVWEWEDGCGNYAGQTDTCHLRGGSVYGSNDFLRCDFAYFYYRLDANCSLGFRCCGS